MRWAPMPSRAEALFKTVLQWLAIALLALILGVILHKGLGLLTPISQDALRIKKVMR